MKCPHCLHAIPDQVNKANMTDDTDGKHHIEVVNCANCNRDNYTLVTTVMQSVKKTPEEIADTKRKFGINSAHGTMREVEVDRFTFRPKTISRNPVPAEVPKKYVEDYKEACLTLADSPKASAALSRRCLQNIIREELEIRERNLSLEIDKVIEERKFSSNILEDIDSIRNIGNFAAHATKSESTGEIVEVEPGEAEWNLDVLEQIFDYQFVAPAVSKRKRAALNVKLNDVGKPPLK